MPHSTKPHSGRDGASIDWAAVRASLRRRLAGQLDPGEAHELEDLIQEGCVRLLRASRREPVEDLEAMTAVIARRTFRDWLRRRYRHERLWRPLDEVPEVAAASAENSRFGDLVERIEFMVMELFRREDRTQCLELARAWFEGRSWKQLAEHLGASHASVRKRWSRCLELPKRLLGEDRDFGPLLRRIGDD